MNKAVAALIVVIIIMSGIIVYYNFPDEKGGFEESSFCSVTAGFFT